MAIMHDSYKELYRKFLVKHPELQAFVSKTTFKKQTPFYLRKVKREGCLCKSRISRCTTACVAKARTTTISASDGLFHHRLQQRIFGKRGSSVRSKVGNSQAPSRARRT